MYATSSIHIPASPTPLPPFLTNKYNLNNITEQDKLFTGGRVSLSVGGGGIEW